MLVNIQYDFQRMFTLVKSLPAFFLNDPLQASVQALLGAIPAGHMRSALDGDVWVGEAGGQDFSQCAQVERILRRHTPAALHYIFQLLENSVLQNWVDHQDQRREDACK